ncbi:hypothetical protein SFMTTN_2228 [Sulfuriferula multivorans]|uniref:Uncharacterized protein n=1 Tax=Sulfuriferula multivorans TaxID=1559896 RepID=A0A401JFK2_9PROT|nr:hypothetical protein [Sulfuriferula multivorans]GBL46415.1 hypothetical protein SFMTTN_2228 [Sulfuriferula multivorans]
MKPLYFVLIPLLLAGCAVVNEAPGTPSPTQAQQSAIIQQRNRELMVYVQQINNIVAHSVRVIRVAQEQQAMKKAGHPVPLDTGWCSAVVAINADGTLKQTNISGCASDNLEKVELEAIKRAAPFPPMGGPFNVVVHTWAPVATPGVNGN